MEKLTIKEEIKCRKLEKERKRRERIANSLEELKNILYDSQITEHRKIDKVEILESAVKMLNSKNMADDEKSYVAGYNACLVEFTRHLMSAGCIDCHAKANLMNIISRLSKYNMGDLTKLAPYVWPTRTDQIGAYYPLEHNQAGGEKNKSISIPVVNGMKNQQGNRMPLGQIENKQTLNRKRRINDEIDVLSRKSLRTSYSPRTTDNNYDNNEKLLLQTRLSTSSLTFFADHALLKKNSSPLVVGHSFKDPNDNQLKQQEKKQTFLVENSSNVRESRNTSIQDTPYEQQDAAKEQHKASCLSGLKKTNKMLCNINTNRKTIMLINSNSDKIYITTTNVLADKTSKLKQPTAPSKFLLVKSPNITKPRVRQEINVSSNQTSQSAGLTPKFVTGVQNTVDSNKQSSNNDIIASDVPRTVDNSETMVKQSGNAANSSLTGNEYEGATTYHSLDSNMEPYQFSNVYSNNKVQQEKFSYTQLLDDRNDTFDTQLIQNSTKAHDEVTRPDFQNLETTSTKGKAAFSLPPLSVFLNQYYASED
ncbi:uncharacterized protein LOC130621440 [Hydractinia symbiolongicarpus]|uniref:uncharacterized protein LOC130621440 n=1 Tax=Hydractinia symbiolongicarpus TaxID=13093 RepID=UPI0025513A10|nr:uncharacterized protein LOC130621440 [Hydractinia symbiolongicarpus]